MEKLSRFTVNWEYRPGRINVADPLSRMYEPSVADPTLAVLDAVLLTIPRAQRLGAGNSRQVLYGPLLGQPCRN